MIQPLVAILWARRCLRPLGITLLMIIALFLTIQDAHAEAIVVSDDIPPKNTNWSDVLSIPAFDPAWGMLTAITITIETPITGSVSYENTSNEAVLITSTHAVTASIELPDGSLIFSVPRAARIDAASPFDGSADFQGTSGASFEMTTTMVITQVFTAPDMLALFYGEEPILFPITATGSSQILGPGNFDAVFLAQAASAAFTIYFTYQPPAFIVEKLTNQRDADDANGLDVPVIAPGAPITWTYLITNTGSKVIPLSDITITDSDPSVTPIFDPSSDNGDQLLSPGEVWRYYAVGVALDLQAEQISSLIVDGCRNVPGSQLLRAYENSVEVSVEDVVQTDPSHYCNPTDRLLLPSLALAKLINGRDADQPNDADVPYVFPGTTITWTYLITNTGNVSFTFSQVNLTDDDPTLTIVFDAASDDGDLLLSPNEVWRFVASSVARNLLLDTAGITIVPGCDPTDTGNVSSAYRNIALLTVVDIQLSDPAHYCNFPPTVVFGEPDPTARSHYLYLPLIAK